MYKQFLNYQHSTVNSNEIFSRMIDCLNIVSDNMKQSFSSRGINTQNIYVETDAVKSVAVVNILWNTISFTTRCNYEPLVLARDDGRNIPSNRIMALKGNYNELMQGVKDHDEEMTRLLENELASLYIPPDETQKCIFKIKFTGQEFSLNQTDAPREVVLKVVEIVCGSNAYHKDGSVRTFTV